MKRIFATLIVLSFLFTTLAGCGSAGSDNAVAFSPAPKYSYSQHAASEEPASSPVEGAGSPADESYFYPVGAAPDKKIIWTVNLNVETTDFDGFVSSLNQSINDLGCYLEGSSVTGAPEGIYSGRYGDFTVRVPTEDLDAFIEAVGKAGTLTYTEKTSEDVTLDYHDTEARIDALETEKERILDLMETAEDIESVIQLESRLSELQYELDGYYSSRNRYDSLIEYSTVYISVRQVDRTTQATDQSFLSRVKNGLSDTWYRLKNQCKNLAVFVIVNLPYIAICAGVIAAAVAVVLQIVKRRRQKKNKTE